MLTDATISGLAAYLQGQYRAAGSDCEVSAYWTPPLYFPKHGLLILHEWEETDQLIGNGLRGNPDQPDLLLLSYFRVATSDRSDPATFVPEQILSRQDKVTLALAFTASALTAIRDLGVEFGKQIRWGHPRGGPYDPTTRKAVRFTWDAQVQIVANLRGDEGA